jgi:hypothetical protein
MTELRYALQHTADTAPGADGVRAKWIKSLPEVGLLRFLNIFNKSWQTGIVPEEWKTGIIHLIPKPGRDLAFTKNWRPICLTSVMGKILERLINRRLMWWLENSDFFLPEQHGFRWFHSTQDNLAEYVSFIDQALQDGDTVAALHMDVEAAYTSVDIDILQLCLKH